MSEGFLNSAQKVNEIILLNQHSGEISPEMRDQLKANNFEQFCFSQ